LQSGPNVCARRDARENALLPCQPPGHHKSVIVRDLDTLDNLGTAAGVFQVQVLRNKTATQVAVARSFNSRNWLATSVPDFSTAVSNFIMRSCFVVSFAQRRPSSKGHVLDASIRSYFNLAWFINCAGLWATLCRGDSAQGLAAGDVVSRMGEGFWRRFKAPKSIELTGQID
jgi:hypothetical protein